MQDFPYAYLEGGSMNSGIGMIPSRANPYSRDDSMYFPHQEPPPKPVLTLTDLDAMVARCVEQARREWVEEQRRACERAWEEGKRFGTDEGTKAERTWMGDKVTEVIRRQLNHTERRLRERADRPKTTIKAERDHMLVMANELYTAIGSLRELDGVDA